MRYPEMLQFRVPPGTASALEAVAAREGRKPSDVAREAISSRIATLFNDALPPAENERAA